MTEKHICRTEAQEEAIQDMASAIATLGDATGTGVSLAMFEHFVDGDGSQRIRVHFVGDETREHGHAIAGIMVAMLPSDHINEALVTMAEGAWKTLEMVGAAMLIQQARDDGGAK